MRMSQDIYDLCDTLQVVISRYEKEFIEIDNWFKSTENDILTDAEEKIKKWRKEADIYKTDLKKEKEKFLALGRRKFEEIYNNESMYMSNDRSYAKRKNAGTLEVEDDFAYPYDDNSNPYEQLKYINGRLQDLLLECARNNPPYIIKEIITKKGTKRYKRYSEIDFLVKRGKVLVELLEKSERTVKKLQDKIDKNTEKEINGITEKSNELLFELDLKYVEEIKRIRKDLENNIANLIPVEDFEKIDDRAAMTNYNYNNYNPSEKIYDEIFMGTFEFHIQFTYDEEYLVNLLSERYSEYIRNEKVLVLPLLVSTQNCQLTFINNVNHSNDVIDSVKGFICRYILGMPVASVNCFFVDGYYSGADFNIFSPLNEVDKNIVKNEVATSPQAINKTLDGILKSNEDIVQKKLIDYSNLFEFNQKSGNVYERYSLLVIDNFPKGFSDETYEKLERILLQCGQCGVSVIIIYDEELYSDEYGEVSKKIELIKKQMYCCDFIDGLLYPKQNYQYKFGVFKTPVGWNDLMNKYSKNVIENSTKTRPLIELLTDDNELFSRNSSEKLIIPFGYNGPGKVQNLVFGDGVSHSGILVGITGSGKSTLLHSIILSAIAHYGPDELELYLLDFKEGMEFSLYSNNQVPQVRFVSIQSQQELGLSVLKRLCDEIENRSDMMKEYGAKDIQTYRKYSGRKMPRILVIIDEFHELFNMNSNYRIAEKCADYMRILIKQGRSFGVNVLISSQGISGLHDISLNHGIYDQMAVRIALRCSEEDADFMFRINHRVMNTLDEKKGIGAYAANDKCSPEKFVVAFMKDEERVEFLKKVSEYYKQQGIESKTVIYDGTKEVYFDKLLKETNLLNGIIGCDEDYKVALGESMGEVRPLMLEFNSKGKNNLLIITNNQEKARVQFAQIIDCLNISKQRDSEYKTLNPYIFFLDYKIQSRKDKTEDLLVKLCNEKEEIAYSKSDRGGREILEILYKEFVKRENEVENYNQPLFLMIFGLQNSEDILETFDGDYLENDDLFDDEDELLKTPGQIFRELLQKGARRGIFVITWMDSSQSVKKLEYGDVDFFGNKLIGKISKDESEALINSNIAGTITNKQWIYCDIDGEIQKLKDYQ